MLSRNIRNLYTPLEVPLLDAAININVIIIEKYVLHTRSHDHNWTKIILSFLNIY